MRATAPVTPLKLDSCRQCGLSLCEPSYALALPPAGTYLTSRGTLVLPSGAPGVNYSRAAGFQGDCDLLLGPGLAFVSRNAPDGGDGSGSSM